MCGCAEREKRGVYVVGRRLRVWKFVVGNEQLKWCVAGLFRCRRERYLLASTYLSSRAFSSDLLAQPTVHQTSSSFSSIKATATAACTAPYPVLIPGMDAFNH